jgi:hypothetical protein
MARLTTLQAHFFSLRPIDGAGFHQPDRYSPRTGLALSYPAARTSFRLRSASPQVVAEKQVSTGLMASIRAQSAPDSGMHRRQDELDTVNLIVPAPVNHSESFHSLA